MLLLSVDIDWEEKESKWKKVHFWAIIEKHLF